MANNTSLISRKDGLVGKYIELIWVHFSPGTINPIDVHSVDKVEIFDALPDEGGQIIQTIPSSDIIKSDTGTYKYIMDPVEYGKGGKFYYDKITYHSDSTSVEEAIGYVWVKDQSASLTVPNNVLRDIRIYLHDDNPDKDYRFSPPEFPDLYRQTSRRNQYVWDDHQLDLAFRLAVHRIHAVPPNAPLGLNLLLTREYWVVLRAAYIEAMLIKIPLWINEEFDYTLGGLSLTINKSEKYKSLMDSLNSNLDEFLFKWKQKYRGKSSVIITYTGVYGKRMSLRVGNPFPSGTAMSLSFW